MAHSALRCSVAFACLLALSFSSSCSSEQKKITDQPSGKIDKSTASWSEPGAVADPPVELGAMDAGALDAGVGLDAGVDASTSEAGAPDASAPDASASDASADAAADAG